MAAATPKSLPLTNVEQVWLLRTLRAVQQGLSDDLMALQERMNSGVEIHGADKYQDIDRDHSVCDTVVRKLWQMT